jgi:hypothetical protein
MHRSKEHLYSIISSALLFQFFPNQSHHTHLAIAGKGCRAGDVYNPISIALYVSDVGRAGPDLVPREIEMVHNLATVIGISAAIGRHHAAAAGIRRFEDVDFAQGQAGMIASTAACCGAAPKVPRWCRAECRRLWCYALRKACCLSVP